MGGSYQQEVDLQALFKDVASEYWSRSTSPAAAQCARPGDSYCLEHGGPNSF